MDAQDLVSEAWRPVVPGIHTSAPDHRPSWLLVQEALVLLILLILCIHVQSVENRFNGTWHLLAIANMDPLFHSRMICRVLGMAAGRLSGGFRVQIPSPQLPDPYVGGSEGGWPESIQSDTSSRCPSRATLRTLWVPSQKKRFSTPAS